MPPDALRVTYQREKEMKLKVNRQLSGGLYHVDFSVGDFSSEEVAKMGSFGTRSSLYCRVIPMLGRHSKYVSPKSVQTIRHRLSRMKKPNSMKRTW